MEEINPQAKFIINGSHMTEIYPWGLETINTTIEWNGNYEFTETYVGSKKGFDRFTFGDKFTFRIVSVSDSSVTMLFPICKNKVTRATYKKQ